VLLLPLLLPVLLLLPLLLLLPVLLLLPLPLLLSVPAVILSAAKDPEELDAPEPSVPFNPYPSPPFPLFVLSNLATRHFAWSSALCRGSGMTYASHIIPKFPHTAFLAHRYSTAPSRSHPIPAIVLCTFSFAFPPPPMSSRST
jgi:hypothetical protein